MEASGYRFGEYWLDARARCLFRLGMAGQLLETPLEPLEYRILLLLVASPDMTFSTDELIEKLRRPDSDSGASGVDWGPADQTIKNCIRGLRKKLGDDPRQPSFIQTRKGFGYRFLCGVQRIPRPDTWYVPHSPNPFLVGRGSLLAELRKRFVEWKDYGRNQALYGLAGIGKTQIAVRYAHQFMDSLTAVFFIDADSRDSMDLGWLSVANRLRFSQPGEPLQELKERVWEWLRSTQDWLLVFDNVSSPDLLPEWVGSQNGGEVLLTSKRPIRGTAGIAEPLSVEPLSGRDSVEFLVKRCHREPQTDGEMDALQQLAFDKLEGLPLGLEQVGAYIWRHNCSFRQYLDMFDALGLEMLEKSRPITGQYPGSVRTALLASFNAIEKEAPDSAALFQTIAILSNGEIPLSVFVEGLCATSAVPFHVFAGSPSQQVVDSLVGPLLDYSLVKRVPEGNTIYMHAVVRAVRIDTLSDSERVLATRNASAAILWALDERKTRPEFCVAQIAACLKALKMHNDHPEMEMKLLSYLQLAMAYAGYVGHAEVCAAHLLSRPLEERLLRNDLNLHEVFELVILRAKRGAHDKAFELLYSKTDQVAVELRREPDASMAGLLAAMADALLYLDPGSSDCRETVRRLSMLLEQIPFPEDPEDLEPLRELVAAHLRIAEACRRSVPPGLPIGEEVDLKAVEQSFERIFGQDSRMLRDFRQRRLQIHIDRGELSEAEEITALSLGLKTPYSPAELREKIRDPSRWSGIVLLAEILLTSNRLRDASTILEFGLDLLDQAEVRPTLLAYFNVTLAKVYRLAGNAEAATRALDRCELSLRNELEGLNCDEFYMMVLKRFQEEIAVTRPESGSSLDG